MEAERCRGGGLWCGGIEEVRCRRRYRDHIRTHLFARQCLCIRGQRSSSGSDTLICGVHESPIAHAASGIDPFAMATASEGKGNVHYGAGRKNPVRKMDAESWQEVKNAEKGLRQLG
ncbi:hypothetical protein EYF80_039078 [Liparis tanakae]|uniref:Uncharacterized protein n=1 Tax=Liparis tanakae TaxID=230148 RepID=A0A4Z2GAY2_9TELE|nr:hypothetical protein EYF80_039078 [Liparis tanakae]